MDSTLIHPDCIVKHAERRALRAVIEAEAFAQSLRRNQVDWLYAFNRITDLQASLNSACFVLAAVLNDVENVAPHARDQVETVRQNTVEKLQMLQTDLRVNCLYNGPSATADRSAA
jgi:hypothetical protein